MKKTGIVVSIAFITMMTASSAQANKAVTLAPYQVKNAAMLQSFSSGRGLTVNGHNTGRRLKTNIKNQNSSTSLTSSTSVATGQSILNAFTQHRKNRKTISRVSGINLRQQKALTKLAEDMPDQSANFKAYFNGRENTPTFLKFNSKSPNLAMRGSRKEIAQASSRRFLLDYKDLLKIDEPDKELTLTQQHSDTLGNQHFRYQQTVNNIPVWGSELILHLRDDNSAYLLNGRFQPSIHIDTTAELTAAQAEEAVRKDLAISSPSSISSKLVIYPGEQSNPRLAYQVNLLSDLTSRWQYFIDAHNGKVLHRIDYRQHAVVNSSGSNEFGSNVNFRSWQDGSAYYLLDTEVPTPGSTTDPIGNPPASGDTIILDARNGEGDKLYLASSNSPDSGWDETAVTAIQNTINVYEYYLNTFNRNSIDDAGKNLISVIHYSSNYNNASWNGELMVYGDGDGQLFQSLARCNDVTAHELTHGVVGSTAALKYENQSGALNEAYADIFAAMVDRDDWTIGEDCTVASPGYLRNMANPATSLNPQPTKMSEYRNLPNTEDGDNGGVHVNNSIPTHAAYLMAEGLTSKNLGTSIGREKTEQIFYRALTTYLTASSQFIDARNATLQAAEDLYGANSTETTAVATAWDIVEVTDNGTTPDETAPTDTDPVNGDDLMVYVYPDQNGFNNLYAQIMTNPLVYNENNDIFLGNTASANPSSRPAAYTSAEESVVFFVGEDANLYEIDIAQVGQANPSFNQYQLSETSDFWSIALAPDGKYFSYTSNAQNDNNIYVWDLEEQKYYTYTITPPDYSEGDTQLNTSTVFYADSLTFDYTGRYITFDALNCISTESSQCSAGGGYRYWSIGVMDATDGSIFYPISNQSPDIDVGFPMFAQNNNYVIAVDVVDYSENVSNPSSRVMAIDFESQQSYLLHNFGADSTEHYGVPSFWGDDLSVSILTPDASSGTSAIRKQLNTNGDNRWEAGNSSTEAINPYTVKMPVMHRAGQRNNTGNVTPASSQINFATVTVGEQKLATLTLSNTGNSDVNITNIQLNGNDFSHNGTNILLPRSSNVTWALSFNPSTSGVKTDSLTITSDTSTVTVALTGTAVDSTTGGGDTGGGDTGGGDTGGGDTGGETSEDSSSGSGLIGFGMLFPGLILWILRRYYFRNFSRGYA